MQVVLVLRGRCGWWVGFRRKALGTIITAEWSLFASTGVLNSVGTNFVKIIDALEHVVVVDSSVLKALAVIWVFDLTMTLLACHFLCDDDVSFGLINFNRLPLVSAGRRSARNSS